MERNDSYPLTVSYDSLRSPSSSRRSGFSDSASVSSSDLSESLSHELPSEADRFDSPPEFEYQPDSSSPRSPSSPSLHTWADHSMVIEAVSCSSAEGLPDDLRRDLKRTEIQLSTMQEKVWLPRNESILPSSFRVDLDGLCIVGLPGKPLSFLSLPPELDENMVICSSPKKAPKFSAGNHSFSFGSSATKYGSGSVCSQSDLPLNGSTRFYCFGRYGSWPLFFSHDDEEEKEDFWKRVIIPSIEACLPERRNPLRKLSENPYPWPQQDQFKLNRREMVIFVDKMQTLCNPKSVNLHRFCKTLTMTVKLGQKSVPLRGEDVFSGTVGIALKCFDLSGTSCLFWSTGVNLIDDHDDLHAFFWLSGFLADELDLRTNSGGKKSGYGLLGTNQLMSAQAKRIKPLHFQRSDSKLSEMANDFKVDFQIETWQFYSTFAYLFKEGKSDSIPCNPNSPSWRNGSTALQWLLQTLGGDKGVKSSPLDRFLAFLDRCSDRYGSALRVEPTFFLRFGPNSGSSKERSDIFRSLFVESAEAVGKVYLDACLENESTHFCCLHSSVLIRLKTLATCYKLARDHVTSIAKARQERPGIGPEAMRPCLSPQEGELLNFLEYSPFFWLTGKSFKVCPRVMKALMVDFAVSKFNWPALPEALFGQAPSLFYSDLLPKPVPSRQGVKRKGKWLSKSSMMNYMPQLWFQAKSNPSTSKMKAQIALLLEFAIVLDKESDDPLLVVNHFLLLFAYCCLLKSGVQVRAPVPQPPLSGASVLDDLAWMYHGEVPAHSDSDSSLSDSDDSYPFVDRTSAELPAEDEDWEAIDSPVPPADEPLSEVRMPSLCDVKVALATRPGPLFEANSAQEGKGSKRKSLVELLEILFINPVVVTSAYSCPKQDVWVAALCMLQASFEDGSEQMKRLKKKSTFLNLLITGWRTYLQFEAFWHCTKSSFAKKSSGLFKLTDGLDSLVPPSLSAAGSDGPSDGGSKNRERKDRAVIALHTNATLYARVIDEMRNKADDRFQSKKMVTHPVWSSVIRASCLAAQEYGRAEKKEPIMVVKFAIICSVRIAFGLQLLVPSDQWGDIVLKKYDKHSGHNKVKVNMLAKYTPFFIGSSKIKCLDVELLKKHVQSMANKFVVE